MTDILYDDRLKYYEGNIDIVADDIAAQISYDLIDIPSLQEIQDEIRPKIKKTGMQV